MGYGPLLATATLRVTTADVLSAIWYSDGSGVHGWSVPITESPSDFGEG